MKISSVRTAIGSMIMTIGFAVALPASAEMGGGMMGGQGGNGTGMQQMSGLMRDMSGQMMSMSGEMGKGNMTPEMQKQMSERMRSMSGMMDSMSGMMGKGMMMDAPQQQRMGEMRKQMDGMMQGSPMSPR